MNNITWIIDNGHGYDTGGKRSPVWGDGSQLMEYEFNRNIVKFINMEAPCIKDGRTRIINDVHILVEEGRDVSLAERVRRTNHICRNSTKHCILLSVHGNAFSNESVNGLETFYYSETGKKVASIFQKHLLGLGFNDRGVKKANFYILKHPVAYSVLTENGFYTNEKECRRMMDLDFQYDIALKHLEAMKEIELSFNF